MSTPAVEELIKDAFCELKEDEMKELLSVIEKLAKDHLKEIEDILKLNPDKIVLNHSMFKENSPLREQSELVINTRVVLLLKFMQSWVKLIKFVDFEDYDGPKTLSTVHKEKTQFMLKSSMAIVVEKKLFETLPVNCNEPRVHISRRKALMFEDSGKVDHAGTSTVFGQAVTKFEELSYYSEDFDHFKKNGVETKFMDCVFYGEGGIDAGGLFRDA